MATDDNGLGFVLHPAPNTARRLGSLGVIAMVGLAFAQPTAALNIRFNYDFDDNNFFAPGSGTRSALETAGAWFETHITDSLLPITSGGSGNFSARFRDPSSANDAGTDFAIATLPNFTIAADTVMVIAGAIDINELTLYGGGTIAVAQPGFELISSPYQHFRDEAISRGQGLSGLATDINNIDDTSDLSANDFSTWGGAVSFDIDRNWHTDVFSAPANGTLDLYSVALHELAHIFGIGTSDSWFNQVIGTAFSGANSTKAYGGAVPLSGSGRNGAHWANNIGNSPRAWGFEAIGATAGVSQETSFDPIISTGSRKFLTELDVAGLRDVGWHVVPLPPGLWLLFSGTLAVVIHRHRHRADGHRRVHAARIANRGRRATPRAMKRRMTRSVMVSTKATSSNNPLWRAARSPSGHTHIAPK